MMAQGKTKGMASHREKRYSLSLSGMSQSCHLTVVISAITFYHQRNCDQRYKSSESGQHPKIAIGKIPSRSHNLCETCTEINYVAFLCDLLQVKIYGQKITHELLY